MHHNFVRQSTLRTGELSSSRFMNDSVCSCDMLTFTTDNSTMRQQLHSETDNDTDKGVRKQSPSWTQSQGT